MRSRSSSTKRLFDLTVAALALFLLSPLLGLLALLVRVKLGSPILFRQQRPGLHGKPFTLVKFRTMTDKRDAQGNLLPDAQRLMKFGKFLRASSLDELPELWNVLIGEMSLVGPRPLLMQYLPLYTPEQARRHGWDYGTREENGRNARAGRHPFYCATYDMIETNGQETSKTTGKIT